MPSAAAQAFHAHVVDGHALQDPAGYPPGHRLSIVGGVGHRRPENRDVTVIVAADHPGLLDVQQCGVPGDGKVSQPAVDVVTELSVLMAARARVVDVPRVAEQMGDVPAVGGVVDRQAEFYCAADGVGDDVGSGGGVGRVCHGSCG